MIDENWNRYLVLFQSGSERFYGAEDLQDLVQTVKQYHPKDKIVAVYKDMEFSEIEDYEAWRI